MLINQGIAKHAFKTQKEGRSPLPPVMIPLKIEKKGMFGYYAAAKLALHNVSFYKEAIHRHNYTD